MGNTNQSVINKSTSILEKYTFLSQLSDGKSLYKNNKTSKQYITVQRTFANHEMLFQYDKKIKKILEIDHPYFLNEAQHAIVTSSTICSMQHRVVHFFQYQPHTLQTELQTRKKHQRYFEQKEVWSILCSCVLAMAHLTKNEISCYSLHPKDIVIDKLGMIKIISPMLSQNNNQQILNPSFYYSPQHLKSLKQSIPSNLTNKSSIFTLGITLLHIIMLEPLNQIYNYENYSINKDLLNELVQKIQQEELKQIIKKMIKFHGYDRITFTQLQQMLYNILETDQEESKYKTTQITNYHSKIKSSKQTLQGNSQIQKLQESIYKVNKTQENPKQTFSFQKQYQKNIPTTSFTCDVQDVCQTFCYQSVMDFQKVDQQDIHAKNQGLQTGRKLSESDLFVNHHQNAINYSINYNSTALNNNSQGLKERSTNLHSSLQNIANNSFNKNKNNQLQNSMKTIPNTHQYHHTQNQPYHIREQLTRGVYQGYKVNKMRHGYGVFYYAQGGKYAGQWVKNKMQGRGALYYANQQIAYEGQWKNDKLHGYGILYNEVPTYFTHEFDYKSLHLADNYWIKYEGNFVEDQKNGEGTLFLANGQYYRGYFKDDMPHGNGIYKRLNGNLIKGNWILGMMQN